MEHSYDPTRFNPAIRQTFQAPLTRQGSARSVPVPGLAGGVSQGDLFISPMKTRREVNDSGSNKRRKN